MIKFPITHYLSRNTTIIRTNNWQESLEENPYYANVPFSISDIVLHALCVILGIYQISVSYSLENIYMKFVLFLGVENIVISSGSIVFILYVFDKRKISIYIVTILVLWEMIMFFINVMSCIFLLHYPDVLRKNNIYNAFLLEIIMFYIENIFSCATHCIIGKRTITSHSSTTYLNKSLLDLEDNK